MIYIKSNEHNIINNYNDKVKMILISRLAANIKYVVTTSYSAIKMGLHDKIDNVLGSNVIKRSFIEEAVKCLLRELINAGHSIRMCLLRLLKTYLRNRSTENRLNGLAHMYLNSTVTIDVNDVITRFASRKNRRLVL